MKKASPLKNGAQNRNACVPLRPRGVQNPPPDFGGAKENSRCSFFPVVQTCLPLSLQRGSHPLLSIFKGERNIQKGDAFDEESVPVKEWCSEQESNLHGLNAHQILSLARLPIPPPELGEIW